MRIPAVKWFLAMSVLLLLAPPAAEATVGPVRIARYGVSVTVPARWDGRIYRRPGRTSDLARGELSPSGERRRPRHEGKHEDGQSRHLHCRPGMGRKDWLHARAATYPDPTL